MNRKRAPPRPPRQPEASRGSHAPKSPPDPCCARRRVPRCGVRRGGPYADERHIVASAQYFTGAVTIEKLRDYREVIGPLPFILYGKIGEAVGFELWKMRLVSLVLSVGAVVLFYAAFARATGRPWEAFLAATWLMTSPYMVRMSVSAFTDMLPMTLLCRQYYAFVPMGAVLCDLGRAWSEPSSRARSLAAAAASALAVVPFALLMLLWGGAHPPNGDFWIPEGEPICHPHFLTAYLVMTSVYLAPWLLWRWRAIYAPRLAWVAMATAALWYVAFPVELSRIAAMKHSQAIGVFHRFAQVVSGGSWAVEHAILFVAFVVGAPVVVWLARELVRAVRARDFTLATRLDLMLLAFYVLMPFSYQLWEKYFLPIVALGTLRLVIAERRPEAA